MLCELLNFCSLQGSASQDDWITNFNIELMKKNGAVRGADDVKVHTGFVERTKAMLNPRGIDTPLKNKERNLIGFLSFRIIFRAVF